MSNSRPTRAAAAAIAALLAALLSALVPAAVAAAETETDTEPQPVIGSIAATKVDASTLDAVEVVLSGAVAGVTADDVAVTIDGGARQINEVASSQASGRPTELVIVVDTNSRGARGDLLRQIKTQLTEAVSSLSSQTAVAVISAGDSALIETTLTSDNAQVVEAIGDLSTKNGTTLFNALDRAATLFSGDPGVIQAVVVVSTGPDTKSAVTAPQSLVGIVQSGTQLVTVRYDGGEPELVAASSQTGGADFVVAEGDDIAPALASAVAVATERLVVSFEAPGEVDGRSNVTLAAGGASTEFSYPAGTVTEVPLQLAPVSQSVESGLAFFRTSAGLYVALALAFVGITLGVWSLGSILAGRDASLDGMLSRYTDGSIDMTDSDQVEELIVQSALLQRAVDFSESFAEKRGFLARVEELLERANLPVRAGEAMFILAAIGILTSGLGLVLTRSLLAAVLFGFGASGIAFFVVRFLGRRRFKTFESQLPDTLQLLSGTLRAGYSLPQGFEVVSKEIGDPMGQELRRAMTEARLGRELEESLSGVSERMASADFAWAVMAISIQREVGGNLNELLMSVADTMIARERLKREIGALTAEGRMSAGVLSFLPPGLGFVMWLMNPEYVEVLFTEFLGNILLGCGVVSALIGLAWMKKVITIDV